MSNNLDDAVTGPLVKSVTVRVAVDRAFELFTTRMTDWWPLATHSVGADAAVAVRIEGHPGGEIVETISDGRTTVWGTVTDWEPPVRVSFTWHPGNEADQATRVTVRFTDEGGSTRVELTHTGWDLPSRVRIRASYDRGWEIVLGQFVDYVSA
jgi:uncharacterized protein YndB with AHSA1/START domain